MTFTEIVQALDQSKKRIEDLQAQLTEEQSNARSLLEQFQQQTQDMMSLLGISTPAAEPARKTRGGKRNMSEEGRRNIALGAMMRRYRRENPKATETQLTKQREKFLSEMKG